MSVGVTDDTHVALRITRPLEPACEVGPRHACSLGSMVERLLELVVDEHVINEPFAKPHLEHRPLACRIERVGVCSTVGAARSAGSAEVREIDIATALVTVVSPKWPTMLDACVANLDSG